jgi:hypothetical protein
MLDRAQLVDLARELIGTDYDLEVAVRIFDWGIDLAALKPGMHGREEFLDLDEIRDQLRRELRIYQDEIAGDWCQSARRKRVAA